VYLVGCYEMWSSLPYFSDAFAGLAKKRKTLEMPKLIK